MTWPVRSRARLLAGLLAVDTASGLLFRGLHDRHAAELGLSRRVIGVVETLGEAAAAVALATRGDSPGTRAVTAPWSPRTVSGQHA